MSAAVITAVGIDVSKYKSTMAARRPGGEVALLPFGISHADDYYRHDTEKRFDFAPGR